jgi:two-component system copper resistance phosphate regulon response regulator CusR
MGGVRLLLVEDEPLTIRMLAKGLREQAYAVDVAESAQAAAALIVDHDYDLIVLDLGLPDADGLTLCRRIREAGTTAPILILTARDAVDSRIAGLDSGADDYLLKPFDFGELLARLRALIRRGAHPPQDEQLRVGDLLLDTRAQSASCGGTALPLTTREYALLEFLARRAGRVVTREDIAEHVWDSSYDPLSNVIDVYIRRLRAKLAPTACHEVIRTRRGAGYVLSADWTEQDA